MNAEQMQNGNQARMKAGIDASMSQDVRLRLMSAAIGRLEEWRARMPVGVTQFLSGEPSLKDGWRPDLYRQVMDHVRETAGISAQEKAALQQLVTANQWLEQENARMAAFQAASQIRLQQVEASVAEAVQSLASLMKAFHDLQNGMIRNLKG